MNEPDDGIIMSNLIILILVIVGLIGYVVIFGWLALKILCYMIGG